MVRVGLEIHCCDFDDTSMDRVILSVAKNLSIRGMRYFTAFSMTNYADSVILSEVKNLCP